MRDLKASVFSTVAEQTAKATCAHRWTEYAEPSRIFGYLVVEAECAVCGTYRGRGEHDGSPASVRGGERGERGCRSE